MFLIAYAIRIGFAVSKKKKKKFLSLCAISNHALTIFQRLSQCLSPGSYKAVISHNASLLLSPGSPYLMLPPWECQGGDQSPLLPAGVGLDWELAPRPYLWPFLVSWSVPPMSLVRAQPARESEHQSERELGVPLGGTPPSLSRDSFAPARPNHQSGSSRGRHGWNLAGASRNVAETSTQETKHHTRRVGELGFITLVGPEKLTLQALSPKGVTEFLYMDRHDKVGL